MNKSNELRIRFLPDEAKILLESHSEGVITCKQIQEEALLQCIKQSISGNFQKSGFLPPNCIHVGISPNGEKEYCLWYPHLHADISYHETAYPNFPLPRLVFAFRTDTSGKASCCRIGVAADGAPTPETKMYRYPFSNVSGGKGSLCIGRNTLPQYKNPQKLANLPTFLLSIPNNDDSFSTLNNRPNLQYRDLLEHLKDKDPSYYYTDILISNGQTLKDFIGG